jgi:glycosyltransferase involved in cell wall biosynthesis
MKIVIASPIYPPEIGGPATYTKELAEKLSADHVCTIVAYTNNNQSVPGTTLVAVLKDLSLPMRLGKYFLALMKATKKSDVIYVQNAMAAGLPAVLVGMIQRKPVILKFVGDEAWERATQHKKTEKRLVEFLAKPDAGLRYSLMMWIQGWVLRHATIVTTPSKYLGNVIHATYRVLKNKLKTNYNAAEKTTAAPFATDVKKHQVATSARLVPWKGVDGILEAIKKLVVEYPDIHLVVNGDGPERNNLELLAEKLNIQKQVTFTGNVSRTETWHTRKESEVYVLNSTYEGLPHTALTSFAAEIPMIATDIPGTNEAVYNEKSGLRIPPNDSDALASAIKRVFEDKVLAQQLIEGGSKILTEKFSWEAHIKTLLDLFESTLTKPIQ